jgi:tetratricopeptide (TPR) repeat protein
MTKFPRTRWALAGIFALLLCASGCGGAEERGRKAAERADAYAAQGKIDEAIVEYRNALKATPRDGDARFKLGNLLLRKGNSEAASKELVRAAELLPKRADVQTRVALIMMAHNDFEAARRYAEAAVNADGKNVEAQIVLANTLARLKDIDGAVRELEEAIQLAPTDARPYTSLGSVRATQRDDAAAEAAYKKAVDLDPKSIQARLGLAFFYWTRPARRAEAESVIQSALALDSSDRIANRMLAMLYLSQNRSSDAETPLLRLVNMKDRAAAMTLADVYTRAGRVDNARGLYESLKADKGYRALATTRLAQLEYGRGRRDDAHRILTEALKGDPTNPTFLQLQARWLLDEHKVDEALELAKKSLAAAPQSAAANYTIGVVYLARGDAEEATKAFNETLRLNPQASAAELQLSRALLLAGDATHAVERARAVVKSSPQNLEARLALVSALIASRDVTGATAALQPLLKEHPENAAVHSFAGELLARRGEIAAGLAEIDRALQIDPGDLRALSNRLAADLARKNIPEGRTRLTRALSSKSGSSAVLVIAGKFERAAGDARAGEAYFRRAIEADPANLEAYNLLGQLFMQQKRLDEARREYEEFAKRRPNSVAARTMVGIILDVQSRPHESQKVYESIVNTSTKAPVAANNLAWIYAERGERLDEALQLAQRATEQMPDHADVNDTLGWVYYKKDMPELAIRPFERSVEKDPTNPIFRYHLGLAYAKAGRLEKARKSLEEALRLKSDFPGADDARNTLASLRG